MRDPGDGEPFSLREQARASYLSPSLSKVDLGGLYYEGLRAS